MEKLFVENSRKMVVVLVNYNNNTDTVDCVKSIAKSEGIKLPFIIVVDNNSKLKTIEEDLNFYPNLKVIYNNENIGFGRANNIGINWANNNLEYKYILLLNNDTVIEPITISTLTQQFKISEEIGITTCKTNFYDLKYVVWYGGGQINSYRGWPKIYDYGKLASNEGANQSRYVDFVSGCVMMFSKKSISQLIGFDDVFFMYCEDLELSLRARKLGIKIYYTSETTIYHKVQGSLKNQKQETSGLTYKNPNLPFLWFHMKLNQWIVFHKHLGKLKFLIFNLLYWSEFTLKLLFYLLRGRYDLIKPSLNIINSIITRKYESNDGKFND